MTAPVRTLLLTVALSADAHVADLDRFADRQTIDEALDLGVLHVDGDRVRTAHPMLASVARTRARHSERRAAHRVLADSASGDQERALHLAFATDGQDAGLAATVAAAAAGASARGARAEAVVLGEQALRLTPADRRPGDRLLSLAEYLARAGERQRVTDLVAPALETLPHGRQRARAWLLLSEGGPVDSHAERARHYRHALAESTGDPDLSAHVLAIQAFNDVIVGVERIREASALPEDRRNLRVLGWARCLRGQPFEDVCERFRASAHGAVPLVDSPEPVLGCGSRGAARWNRPGRRRPASSRSPTSAVRRCPTRGCGSTSAASSCARPLGRGRAAARRVGAVQRPSAAERTGVPVQPRAAGGRTRASRRGAALGDAALADAEARGYRWHALEARRALGTAALLTHDPARAADLLRPVWEHTVREGIDEPGAFPVAGDLVEALMELGEHAEALAVTERLTELSERQHHPWGLATAKRCSASADDAAAEFGRLGLPYDRARSLLAQGRAQRRPTLARGTGGTRRRRRRVRRAGSDGWAKRRAELARVGARRPRPAGSRPRARSASHVWQPKGTPTRRSRGRSS